MSRNSPGRPLPRRVCVSTKQREPPWKISSFHRSLKRGRRQGVRLVHHHHDAGHLLRGVRALRAACADQLGVRPQLFHVRRALHDGRRLYALAQWPCARRRHLSDVATACRRRSTLFCSLFSCFPASVPCFFTAFPMPHLPGRSTRSASTARPARRSIRTRR